MKLTEETKRKNNLINIWRIGASATILVKGLDQENLVVELAKTQIEMLNESRQNKDKPMEEQLNDQQKEFIEYLKEVIETGEF